MLRQTAQTMPKSPSTHAPPAKIGPNALIQTVRALYVFYDTDDVAAMLGDHAYLLSDEPAHMVNEREFAALGERLVDVLGTAQTTDILHLSGRYTADYLLAHRIPGFFQSIVHALPHRSGLRLLLLAIRQHTWAFIGSGQLDYRIGQKPFIDITVYEMPTAASGFYGGTFERLFQHLIAPQTAIIPELDRQQDALHCHYVVQW